MKKVCVLGSGAWGTTVATVLAHNGYQVNLWCHDLEVATAIAVTGVNERYLPGITLDPAIVPTSDIGQGLADVDWIFEAVPVAHLRSVLEQAQSYVAPHHTWVVLSKGIEQKTLLLPSQIIDDVLGYQPTTIICSGPSFAHDLARTHMTALTLAADSNAQQKVQQLAQMLSNSYCVPSLSSDPLGTQMVGALKNIIALGVGALHGAGYGDNTKAFFLTRGLQEMAKLVHAVGGTQETVYGLAGVGDLVLTAYSTQSRNVQVGNRLGTGETVDAIVASMGGKVPEGINTAKSVHQLQQKLGLQLPLCTAVYKMVSEDGSVENIMAALMMARP